MMKKNTKPSPKAADKKSAKSPGTKPPVPKGPQSKPARPPAPRHDDADTQTNQNVQNENEAGKEQLEQLKTTNDIGSLKHFGMADNDLDTLRQKGLNLRGALELIKELPQILDQARRAYDELKPIIDTLKKLIEDSPNPPPPVPQ